MRGQAAHKIITQARNGWGVAGVACRLHRSGKLWSEIASDAYARVVGYEAQIKETTREVFHSKPQAMSYGAFISKLKSRRMFNTRLGQYARLKHQKEVKS